MNRQFTGKEKYTESGLGYFGARYYGSALGRWTSPDPTTCQMLTDIDVALKMASVELKAGQKVIDLKKLNRLKALGKPVVWYAPQASVKDVSILRNAGAYGVASVVRHK